ncbi:MAG: bifunctional folylpolyglutamate synthase/dihydrofolate synthase [Gaiellales bacterium]
MTEAENYIGSLELFGMRFGLERMHTLLGRIGNPEQRLQAIHVVGTNGKTSTTRFAEALLVAEGYTTGAYTSPHISTFKERIRVGGQEISAAAYEESVLAVRDAVGREVTQFEALTGAALLAFDGAGVEWAVVEAGLGGRLDATNVLPLARVAVLTNVDLEHTQLLGDTRELIAAEKLAVVRRGAALIVGEPGWTSPQAGSVRTVVADGGFQDQNRAVALAAVEAALGRQVDPSPMAAVVVPGRLEVRGRQPLEVWDGAHNAAGMRRLVAELPALTGGRRTVAVFSTLGEKDVAGMLRSLGTVAQEVIATQSSNPRVLAASALAELTGGAAIPDPVEARALALEHAGPDGAVIICGSLYVLHDLAERLTVAVQPLPPVD